MKNTAFIYETLANLGLNRSQTNLYLEFLKSGSSTIAQTATSLNTSRQAIYLLLPTLLDRGLVKEIKQGKRSLYQALPPSQLFTLVDDIKTRLENVVPELTNILAIPAEVPLVTVYDTPLSMREWYRYFMEQVKPGDDFLVYSSGDLESWYKLDEEFYKKYMERQVSGGAQVRCLLPVGKKTTQHNQEVGWSITEYRYTHHQLSPKVHQWIWQNQVCYQTIQGNATNMIVLQSEQLAEFSTKQFYEIWEHAQI